MSGESGTAIDRSDLRPDDTECNHRAERALKLLWESPDERAVRIESEPNPMFVTVEDGELAFWAFNYTWRCQERVPVEETHTRFETVVDELHAYVNSGYGIGTVSKDRIDTERRPRTTNLGDYA